MSWSRTASWSRLTLVPSKNLEVILVKKVVLVAAFVVAVAVVVLFAQPIVVGVVGPFEQEAGSWIRFGSTYAAEAINADGGILGREIKLIFEDDGVSAEKLKSAMAKLVLRDRVDFLLGGYSSGSVLGAMNDLPRYKVIWLGTGAASPQVINLIENDYESFKYYFRVGTLDSTKQAVSIGEFIANDLGPKYGITRVGIITLDWTYSRDIAETAAAICEEAGMEIVFRSYFSEGTTDFAPIFTRAEQAGAQIIIDAIVTDDGIQFVKQWYSIKPNFAIVGAVGPALKPEFFEQTNGMCVYETSAYPNGGPANLTGKTLEYFDDFQEKYGIFPGFAAFSAHDALYVLKAALEKVGNTKDTEAIISALKETDFPGGPENLTTVAPVKFTEFHDLEFGGLYAQGILFQWQVNDGIPEWIAVYPELFKTGDWQKPHWVEF